MALDPKAQAALALNRFGLGPRAGSIAAIASDPRGALLAELDRPGAGRITESGLMSSGEAARAAFEFRQMRQAARANAPGSATVRQRRPPAMATDTVPGDSNAPSMAAEPAKPTVPRNAGPNVPQQIYIGEAKARINAALVADIGVVERLAWFWSNHFCVSVDKGPVRFLAGAYEGEAIRAHLFGRFADMLVAVESHPAMLLYLDNARSIGPDSVAGRRQGKGLNENLAREILELHTLGVRTGYTQADVTCFASVITGWSIIPPREDALRGGEFTFNPRMHEPGAQTVVGKTYPDQGFEQGRAVLNSLARHPATAKHIAAKLARHFIADNPPAALVERLTKRFQDTDGNLNEVTRTLVTSSESWDAPRDKLKRPGEWIVGALRATAVVSPDIGPVLQAQALLGEPLWRPSAPKGLADENAAWLDGLAQRLDVANQLARRVAGTVDPKAVFEDTLSPLASAETRQTVARAESRPQALALLLMAPEFQRR